MGGGGAALWWVTLAVMVGGAMCQVAPPQLIKVGDRDGWRPNFNYSQWATTKKFYVGYWLIFNFDKHMYNVLEVNQTSYESCNDQHFITNITKGGRDVFNLTQARPYYFLSSGGYCWGGMKLAINVTDFVASAPALAPAPAKSSGSISTVRGQLFMFIGLNVSIVWALFLKLH